MIMNLLSGGGSQSASAARPGNLAEYNARVLQLQELAFTLACDLLGEESLAVEVLQQVLVKAFGSQGRNQSGFNIEILSRVLQACLKCKNVLAGPAIPGLSTAGLSNEELIVMELVDRLELSYAEAAEVSGMKPLAIRARLAEARFILNNTLPGEKS